MCRSSRMINAALLKVVSDIKDNFHPEWDNNAADFQPAENN